MASQVLAIAKICEDAATVIQLRFSGWNEARRIPADSPNEWRPDQWPAEVHAEADILADAIREHCHEPPIVFFTEYVDHWSFCPPAIYFEHRDLFGVHTQRYEVFCLPLPQCDLVSQMAKVKRRSQFAEDRTFASHVIAAVEAWQPLVPESGVLIFLRRVVSGSLYDREVSDSLNQIPAWL